MSEPTKTLEELRKKLDAMPRTDRGFSYTGMNLRDGSELRAYADWAETLYWIINNQDALVSALTASASEPEPVANDIWLVTNGPDGKGSQVVIGFEALQRHVVATIFGDPDEASEEAQQVRDQLANPDEWNGGDRWYLEADFEDGDLRIQRITDMPANPVPTPDESWKKAFAAQSRKLEAVLHIPGVKEALAELKWPDPLVPTPDGEVTDALERYRAQEPFGGDMVSNPQGTWVRFDDAMAKIAALSHPADGWRATHRHVKRGTEYTLLGIGKMQAEKWQETTVDRDPDTGAALFYSGSVDMREVAIYRSVDDGSLWARPREEFEDGRFEPLAAKPEGE